jgi:hypothetical protein
MRIPRLVRSRGCGLCFRPLLFLVAACASVPAAAEGSSVGYNEGGYVPDFIAVVRRYNMSSETFRIEGVCKSACTLFLAIRNVCRPNVSAKCGGACVA